MRVGFSRHLRDGGSAGWSQNWNARAKWTSRRCAAAYRSPSPCPFLTSTQARYITGSVLAVDGGWMSFKQPGDAHPPVDATPSRTLLSGRTHRPANRARHGWRERHRRGRRSPLCRKRRYRRDADRDGAAAAELAGLLDGKNPAKSVDVAVESEVVALFEELRGRFGRIDVLVNGAAVADTLLSGIEEIPEQIEHVLDVNLTGAFTCAREAMCPGGVILNLGSINSFLPFAPHHAYGASKAGMDILTRCMAAELGLVGIRTQPPSLLATSARLHLFSWRRPAASTRQRLARGRHRCPRRAMTSASQPHRFLVAREKEGTRKTTSFLSRTWAPSGAVSRHLSATAFCELRQKFHSMKVLSTSLTRSVIVLIVLWRTGPQ